MSFRWLHCLQVRLVGSAAIVMIKPADGGVCLAIAEGFPWTWQAVDRHHQHAQPGENPERTITRLELEQEILNIQRDVRWRHQCSQLGET